MTDQQRASTQPVRGGDECKPRRRLACCAVVCAAWATYGVASPSSARAVEARTARIEWDIGPGTCVEPASVEGRVNDLFGRAAVVSGDAELQIAVRVRRVEGADRVGVELARGDEPLGERELRLAGDACDEAEKQLALVVVLMIDPMALTPPVMRPLPPPLEPSLEIGESALHDAKEPLRLAVQPKSDAPVEPWARVGVAIGAGMLPDASAGLRLSTGALWPAAGEVSATLTAWSPQGPLDDVSGADVSLTQLALHGCPAFTIARTEPLSIGGCGGLELSRYRARGLDLQENREDHALLAHPALRGFFGWKVAGPLQVGARVDLALPLQELRLFYSLEESEVELFRLPRAYASAGLWVGLAP